MKTLRWSGVDSNHRFRERRRLARGRRQAVRRVKPRASSWKTGAARRQRDAAASGLEHVIACHLNDVCAPIELGRRRSQLRPHARISRLDRLVRGHSYVLEVRGRKTGKTISLPVDPIIGVRQSSAVPAADRTIGDREIRPLLQAHGSAVRTSANFSGSVHQPMGEP